MSIIADDPTERRATPATTATGRIDHVVAHDHLIDFNPQALSNTVRAYATAGVNHPQLFKKMANHMVGLDPSRDFNTLIIIIYPIPI